MLEGMVLYYLGTAIGVLVVVIIMGVS